MVEDTEGVERLVHRLEPCKDTLWRLVVDRHEESRARRERRRLLRGREGDATDSAATPTREKSYQPVHAWQSDPGKVDGEDDQQGDLEPRHTAHIEHLIH